MKKILFRVLLATLVIASVFAMGFNKNNTVKAGVVDEEAVLNTTDYDVNNDGVKDPVYEISNASQLVWYLNFLSETRGRANAILLEDIELNTIEFDANGVPTTDPATLEDYGQYSVTLNADFNGNNKTISGFYSEVSPLFLTVNDNGNVHDLVIEDAYVNMSGSYAAVVAKYNYGVVANCEVAGYVKGTAYAAGVVGQMGNMYEAIGSVDNCIVNVVVVSEESSNVCGVNYGTVTNCISIANNEDACAVSNTTSSNPVKEEGNYYLAGTEAAGATKIDAAKFVSGEFAWTLNNGVTDGSQKYYQTVGMTNLSFDGKTVYRFANCTNTIYTYHNVETPDMSIHQTLSVFVEKQDANCFENGHVEHYQCLDCEKYLDRDLEVIEDIVIKACNHEDNNYVSWTDEDYVTCYENGTIGYYYCENCGVYYNEDKVIVTDLEIISCYELGLIEWVPQADARYEIDGHIAHYYCSGCDKYYDEEQNPLTVEDITIERYHGYGSWVIDQAATTEEEGLAHRVCKECGAVQEKVLPVREEAKVSCKAVSAAQVISYLSFALSTAAIVLFRKRK